ncbi:hypothetical protein MGI18_11845 [Bacillus sp. OVS6]|nr:hypothetical protein MGI18_11845 [Bacillus sp. OVS6]
MRNFVFSALFILLALSACTVNQGSQGDTPEDHNGKPINVRNTVDEQVEKNQVNRFLSAWSILQDVFQE